MGSIAPRKHRKSKHYLKHLNRDEKQAKIDKQVEKIKAADQRLTSDLWRRADELAALQDIYRACYGKPLSAKKLQQISGIDLNSDRLALHAKLSRFFPKPHRKEGVGMRVYEIAFKFNQALKREKRELFTAEQLSEQMEPGRSADVTREYLGWAAQERDGRDLLIQKIAEREATIANPHQAVNTTEKWLRLIERDPSYAIGAAIASIERESCMVYKINEALNRMGCKWYLTWDDPSFQIDMFEDEAE